MAFVLGTHYLLKPNRRNIEIGFIRGKMGAFPKRPVSHIALPRRHFSFPIVQVAVVWVKAGVEYQKGKFSKVGELSVIGSAAFIAPGIAVSATHVLYEDFLKSNAIFLLISGQRDDELAFWHVKHVKMDPESADVAILRTRIGHAQGVRREIGCLEISESIPKIGDQLMLIGFRQHQIETKRFKTRAAVEFRYHIGGVTDFYPVRRCSQIPSPSVQVDTDIPGGYSGGPAIDTEGKIVGVISKSIPKNNFFPATTTVSLVKPILEACDEAKREEWVWR